MMKRAWALPVVILCTSAIAGCTVSATGTGLTPGFAAAARHAHDYIEHDMIPYGRLPQFPAALEEARARVKAAEARAVNDADRGVWLILTMVNVKANEARKIYEIQAETGFRKDEILEALKDVVAERTQCLNEVEGWLSGDQSRVAALNAGPCLQSAKLAAALLEKH